MTFHDRLWFLISICLMISSHQLFVSGNVGGLTLFFAGCMMFLTKCPLTSEPIRPVAGDDAEGT